MCFFQKPQLSTQTNELKKLPPQTCVPRRLQSSTGILVQVTIYRRPTIYRNLYENTGPGGVIARERISVVPCTAFLIRKTNLTN